MIVFRHSYFACMYFSVMSLFYFFLGLDWTGLDWTGLDFSAGDYYCQWDVGGGRRRRSAVEIGSVDCVRACVRAISHHLLVGPVQN